jgi:hypothetical protein
MRRTLCVTESQVGHLRIFLQFRLGGALVQAGLSHAVEVLRLCRLVGDPAKIANKALPYENSVSCRNSSAFAASASVCRPNCA